MRSLVLALAVMMAASPGFVVAADYIYCVDSTDGSDAAAGTELAPYKTVRHATTNGVPNALTGTDSGHIKDIKAYISTIHALEGQGGDKATFRVARKICDSGVDKAEAMALMFEWNQTNAHPEWSPRDLYRKLDIAYGTKQ